MRACVAVPNVPVLPDQPRVGDCKTQQADDQLSIPDARLEGLVQCILAVPVLVEPVNTTHVLVVRLQRRGRRHFEAIRDKWVISLQQRRFHFLLLLLVVCLYGDEPYAHAIMMYLFVKRAKVKLQLIWTYLLFRWLADNCRLGWFVSRGDTGHTFHIHPRHREYFAIGRHDKVTRPCVSEWGSK
jgi:hypothetical protein